MTHDMIKTMVSYLYIYRHKTTNIYIQTLLLTNKEKHTNTAYFLY